MLRCFSFLILGLIIGSTAAYAQSKANVMLVQEFLWQYGAGSADGKIGPKTRAAIVAYEKDWQLSESGKITADRFNHIVRNHDATKAQWSTTNNQNCKIWNEAPQAQESVTWSGDCKDGYAEGPGISTWTYMLNGKAKKSTYNGQYKSGKEVGEGTRTFTNADGTEQQFSDGAAAYERGEFDTALKLWRTLAEQGDMTAQHNLGTMYTTGAGVPQDYAEAKKWYGKAAERGLAQSQRILGSMYRQGLGVPQDYTEAANWYEKSAKQGDVGAQLSLGTMYSRGIGVAQNDREAARWYNNAADQGDIGAQFNLGVMYISGQGVLQDQVTAHKWFNLAAAQGDKDAAAKRDELSKKMTSSQIAEAQKQAREWEPIQ